MFAVPSLALKLVLYCLALQQDDGLLACTACCACTENAGEFPLINDSAPVTHTELVASFCVRSVGRARRPCFVTFLPGQCTTITTRGVNMEFLEVSHCVAS